MITSFKKFNESKVPRDLDTNLGIHFGQKFKDGSIIVAHSTSSNLLPQILKEGLLVDSEKSWVDSSPGKLFFEVEPTFTHYGDNVYAWKAVQKFGGVEITLYVKVKQKDLYQDKDDADLGLKYQKNQKEYYKDIPPENILGLNFVRMIDIKPSDFLEFYKMMKD